MPLMHVPLYNMNIPQPYTIKSRKRNIITVPYVEPNIRVLLSHPNNQDIPYPYTKSTIPSMPQSYTIS
jgi:hypothetical protein